MSKLLRRTFLTLGVLLGLALITAAVLYIMGGSRLNRSYAVPVSAVTVSLDQTAIDRGRHLAEAVTLCRGCHGDRLQGDVLVDEPLMATVYASNLTSGQGGVGSAYTDIDFVRAIRHGVNREGRGLMIMHSDAYHRLGEADLGAIVAYVKSVAPVDNPTPPTKAGVVGRIMVALGLFDRETMPLIPAETIDHAAPLPQVPPPGVTAEYGQYLVSIALCRMCHGAALTGGPPMDDGSPVAPNIAVHGRPGGWSRDQFVNTIRTGVTPYGRALDREAMPWEAYAKMTDDELQAIWLYLISLEG